MSVFRRLSSSVIALGLSASPAVADPVAQIVRFTGNAEIVRDNAKGPLALGMALEPGDLIKTDATGRVRLHFIDGSTINLGSQSDLLVSSYTSQGPGTERQGELALGQGALRAEAAPAAAKSRLEIRTPLAVTAVRGTQWGILSTAQQSDVIIFEGRVGIRRNIMTGESAVSLTRNHGITVTADRLGPIGRWSPEQLAAFDAATSVPGTEIPFNLATATQPALTPILRPSDPTSPQNRRDRCKNLNTIDCERTGGNDRDGRSGSGSSKSGGKEKGSGNENGSGSGKSF